MKIKFLVDRVVKDEHQGTDKETAFKKGQVVDVSVASAQHWLNRGVAVEWDGVAEDSPQPAKRGPGRPKTKTDSDSTED